MFRYSPCSEYIRPHCDSSVRPERRRGVLRRPPEISSLGSADLPGLTFKVPELTGAKMQLLAATRFIRLHGYETTGAIRDIQ